MKVHCNCGASYNVKATLAGKRVKCKKCSQSFVIPQAMDSPLPDPPSDQIPAGPISSAPSESYWAASAAPPTPGSQPQKKRKKLTPEQKKTREEQKAADLKFKLTLGLGIFLTVGPIIASLIRYFVIGDKVPQTTSYSFGSDAGYYIAAGGSLFIGLATIAVAFQNRKKK